MRHPVYNWFAINSVQYKLYILWAFILLVFLIFPFFTESGDTGVFGCTFHQLTGLSCPTCGMSRSLYELTQFNLLESFKIHLFGPVVYILAIFLFFRLCLAIVSGKSLAVRVSSRVIKITVVAIGIAWIIYWLVRMTIEVILA